MQHQLEQNCFAFLALLLYRYRFLVQETTLIYFLLSAVLTRETPRPKSACVPSEKYSETSERSTQVTQPSWYASQ
uniref:Uncharacterized protein n=1 Tax=Glycine max TaxID=3847 RepID=C6T3T4_SOYBN|nr:unknown [Glycine max]